VIDLQAISRGTAVPRDNFDTTVHSVFREAANLQLENGSRLLTLVTTECDDLPQGIRLDTPPGFCFEKEIHPGERIVCRNGLLGDEHERISIDLRQAKRWKCELPDLEADEISPPVVVAWLAVWQALEERQRRTGADICAVELLHRKLPRGEIITGIMSRLIHELVNAARSLDPAFEMSVAGLIGLGQGLTPSGDDFLVGFLTGLRCLIGKKAERVTFFSNLEKMVIKFSHQTNDISRTYLYHARRGQVSSSLVALVTAIARGDDTDHLLHTAEEAMRIGHCSGMETVTGLLVSLSAWGNGIPQV
jgi:hypothetical protein